jgi:hypothetical protein
MTGGKRRRRNMHCSSMLVAMTARATEAGTNAGGDSR